MIIKEAKPGNTVGPHLIVSRRIFNKFMLGSSFALAAPWVKAREEAKIVIIGGGIGGAKVATELASRLPSSKITLIEPSRTYVTPFFTNHYLTGQHKLSTFSHNYKALNQIFNIKIVHEWVKYIDPEKYEVILNNDLKFKYDKLVIAPGISLKFNSISGYDKECTHLFPHAYVGSGSKQWLTLHQQIKNMQDGDMIAISIPKRPYRCTPAPYERAALIAEYLIRNKPKSKILLLDAKNEFPLMDLVLGIWDEIYGNMIEWVSADFGGAIHSIDKKSGTLISDDEKYRPSVANIIPAQAAGKIALKAELADASGWCPVNGQTFESNVIPDIYLLGDAIDAGDMPKSASAAESQAINLALAIQVSLEESNANPTKLKSSCFFFTGSESAVIIGGEYSIDNERIVGISGYSSDIDEDKTSLNNNAKNARLWYRNLITNTYL